MSTSIRKMQIYDYEDAIALWERTPGMGLSGADEYDHIKKFLEINTNLCYVAMQDSQLIGTILCGQDGRRGYLYHLAVDENFRKQGLGKQLVDHSLGALQDIGIQKCHLFVYNQNISGIAFWSHTGWVIRDELEIMSIDL